ncbi:hypothetical protein KNP414_07134 [Paenibacillus mucilaginosus KNP414]|nr:hypothetical protein KNP414_07134 [Paenibacillus mucilaginosus KNP414]
MAAELKSLVQGLTGDWEGAARERFFQSYTGAHKELEQVSVMLKEVGEELQAIASRFRQADGQSK